ncbi:unnamed protein product [Cochlearia groenlandica]
MNVFSCSINTLIKEGLYEISGVEVGQHFYWQIGGFQVHAQVLITSWVVIAILLGSAVLAVRNPQTIPTGGQNFFELNLSLNSFETFRLFGNILADELVVVVLVSLVPLVVPIPVMFLGLFTSGIQALIFATLAAAYIGESMEGHH